MPSVKTEHVPASATDEEKPVGLTQESSDKVKESRDSGHESSESETPEGERAMTPDVKIGDAGAVPESMYVLHLELPGGEKFDVQVNNTEMLQEIHQVLIEREGTCHRTCYSLQLNGKSLDHYSEIRTVPGLESGSTLKVVEEPYTLRDARIHVRHIRDLVKNPDQGESASASEGTSLSYLPIVGLTRNEKNEKEKQASPAFEGVPPDFALPGAKERPLSQLVPNGAALKSPVAWKNLGLSASNPPIPSRKIKGDILYLYVDTLEKRRVHITCCSSGFYINASDDTVFKPQPASGDKHKATIYHSLVDLMNATSPGFKKNFATLSKKRAERSILDRLPTPYPQYSWISPVWEASEDSLRAEDATQPHRVGIEDHLPGQIRDWNEELQTTNEMARGTLTERLVRDRSVFKIHSDFIGAAVRGAQAVVEGNVMAINPADDPKTHMFIWNNIFFSLGFDVKDHYKELGGDAAAFAATSADLQGVRAYASVGDDNKLATLGMAIIDYKGYRVTAQSIIPGILEREQEQSVVYGSIDFGKSVVTTDKYYELLEAPAKELKILPHEAWNGKEGDEAKVVKLYTSFETKGIVGNDGRYYVLDLLRTMPPDVHFLPGLEVSEFAKAAGFPKPFSHKLVAYRKELVDQFVDYRYMMFVRIATYHINASKLQKEKDEKSEEENLEASAQAAVKATEEGPDNDLKKEALMKAAEVVHSLQKDRFDIRFNPDAFSTTLKHADTEDLKAQQRLIIDCGEFLLTQQIPSMMADLVDCSVSPIDGESLAEQMHQRGINIRYLGHLIKVMPTDAAAWLKALLGCEIVARSAKHVIRTLMQSVKADKTALAAAHILSCLMAPVGAVESIHDGLKKKNNKQRAQKKTSSEWENTNQKSLWKAICDEAESYYKIKIELSGADALLETYHVQKVSLLRRVCRIAGIQLVAKEYSVSAPAGTVAPGTARALFVEDDIHNVFPITKHRNPLADDAKKLFMRGQQEMANGHLKEAYEYTAESVNLMTSVYGAMHGELAQALRTLARLSYILGDPADALSQQHRAAVMAERCYGLDHADTIMEYVNLAHIAFANLLISAALRLLYRARYLLLIAAGENHPFMSSIDANIGVILYAVQEYDLAIKYLTSADQITVAAGETKRLKSAMLNHILSRAHASRGDFRTALSAEKETFTIYASLFGAEHDKTAESNECLRQLTQQAVQFQRRMQDASTKGGANLAQLLPMNGNQPSLATIIDVLNVVNGIIVFQIREPPSVTEVEGGKSEEKSEEESPKKKMEEEALD